MADGVNHESRKTAISLQLLANLTKFCTMTHLGPAALSSVSRQIISKYLTKSKTHRLL